jgi:hypothetical protein
LMRRTRSSAAIGHPLTALDPKRTFARTLDTIQTDPAKYSGWRITFRHIFPPMTLGICVDRR